MSRKLTTKEFTEQASIVHNNFYDYSLVEYINTKIKVKIICPIHGVFFQDPMSHKQGVGCPTCGLDKKTTILARQANKIIFITNSNIIHHNKYDYSLVEYINNHTKVKIICPIHGEFTQSPTVHVNNKCGCRLCSLAKSLRTFRQKYGVEHPSSCEATKEKKRKSSIQKYGVDNPRKSYAIKEKIKQIKLEKYGNPHYLNRTQAQCTCIKLYGVGHNKQIHIADALNNLRDKNWMYNQYITLSNTAYHISNMLNVCQKTVLNYLHIHDIETIRSTGWSRLAVGWLETIAGQEGIHIQHALNGGEYSIPGTKFRVDGYCAETNTVYEFHGDVWHGNPIIYGPTDRCHPFTDSIASELYQSTIVRENQIKSLGYNLVVKWQSTSDTG